MKFEQCKGCETRYLDEGLGCLYCVPSQFKAKNKDHVQFDKTVDDWYKFPTEEVKNVLGLFKTEQEHAIQAGKKLWGDGQWDRLIKGAKFTLNGIGAVFTFVEFRKNSEHPIRFTGHTYPSGFKLEASLILTDDTLAEMERWLKPTEPPKT